MTTRTLPSRRMPRHGPALCTWLAAAAVFSTAAAGPLAAQEPVPSCALDAERCNGKRWALVVGISEYPGLERAKWLDFAHRDAHAFQAFLRSPAGGSMDSSRIHFLVNEQATAANIHRRLRELSTSVGPADTVIVYFAGHASAEEGESPRTFFLASDVDRGVYDVGGIDFSVIDRKVQQLSQKTATLFLILDACRSGKMGAEHDHQLKEAARYLNAAGNRDASNTMRLLSSSSEQLSEESTTWGGGHGAFTYFLLRALHGEAAASGSSALTYRQIRDFVEVKVDSATEQRQSPKVRWEGRPGDTVFVLPPTLLASEARTRAFGSVLAAAAAASPVHVAEGGRRGSTRDITYSRASADLDPAVRRTMDALVEAVYDGRYTGTGGDDAWTLFNRLLAMPNAEPIIDRARNLVLSEFAVLGDLLIARYVGGGNDQPPGGTFREAAQLYRHAIEAMSASEPMRDTYLARQHFLEAYAIIKMRERTRYDEARRLLQRSIDIEPRAAYAYNALGLIYKHLNEFDRAAELFGAAIERAPGWQYPATNLADVYREQGQLSRAITAYTEAIAKDTLGSDAYNNLGNLYLNLGRYVQAERQYRRAIRVEPAYPTAYGNIALMNRLKGRYATAQAHLDTAFMLHERDSVGVFPLWTYIEQGRLHNSMRDRRAALAQFRRTLELAPEYPDPYYYIGDTYRMMDSTAQAERYLRLAIDKDPLDARAYNGLAYLYMYGRPRDYARAERELLTARERIPHSSTVMENLGHLYDVWSRDTSVASAERARLSRRAEDAYLAGLRIDSLSTDGYEKLAAVLEHRQALQAAEQWLTRGVQMNDSSVTAPYALAEFYRRRAVIDGAPGARWSAGREATLRRIVAIDPEFASAHNALGTVYLERQQFDSAAAAFRTAAGLGFAPNSLRQHAVTLQLRASSLAREGQHAAALAAYDLVRQLDPANRFALEGLATSAYLAGQAKRARAYADSALAGSPDAMQRDGLTVLRAKILLDLGDAAGAAAAIDELVPQVAGAFVDSHWLLVKALAHQATGSTRVAGEAFAAAVAPPSMVLDEAQLRSEYSASAREAVRRLRQAAGSRR